MQTGTLVLIVLAAIVSLAIVLYQYFHKSKRSVQLNTLLSFLRFLALFCIFLILINPKLTRNEYVLEKANLIVLLDNSSSINNAQKKGQLSKIATDLGNNSAVNAQFNYSAYSFGQFLNTTDSLSHTEKATNISQALSSINKIYSHENTAIVLATDGNQTLGEDYEFIGRSIELPVFPVVIGDTTQYADLKIDQLNVNKYAFLKNKFPLEVYVSYQGQAEVTGLLTVALDGQTVYRERLTFNSGIRAKNINTLISAKTVGIKDIEVKISALQNEHNLANNRRISAIEVIDEKTNIAIISELVHPDIGALKKAIESNEQRAVTIRKPGTSLTAFEEIDLFILYQPRPSFRAIFEFIKEKEAAKITITGTKTNWSFLNGAQNSFTKESYNQSEEVSPLLNAGFNIFDVSDFSIQEYPPLEGYLGDVLITKAFETILDQKVKGVAINEPLLAVIGNEKEREAVLFAENIWKWRAQTFKNDRSFKNFDDLLAKIILYLSTNEPKSRLKLEYQNTYQGITEATITAAYFDEAFIFDNNANISLNLKNKENTLNREIPMLMMKGYYKADLSNLPSGQYNFTVNVANENISKSGSFTKLDFDVEKQFFSSDYQKLRHLARDTGASLFYPDQTTTLIDSLIENPQFVPTQKSNENVVSLVDFRLLLGTIVLALAAEWFIRKYNGLI